MCCKDVHTAHCVAGVGTRAGDARDLGPFRCFCHVIPPSAVAKAPDDVMARQVWAEAQEIAVTEA